MLHRFTEALNSGKTETSLNRLEESGWCAPRIGEQNGTTSATESKDCTTHLNWGTTVHISGYNVNTFILEEWLVF